VSDPDDEFERIAPTIKAEFHEKVTRLVQMGLVEVHPDDTGKPWTERRLRLTGLGEEFIAVAESVRP
jgi:hypothetical protein